MRIVDLFQIARLNIEKPDLFGAVFGVFASRSHRATAESAPPEAILRVTECRRQLPACPEGSV